MKWRNCKKELARGAECAREPKVLPFIYNKGESPKARRAILVHGLAAGDPAAMPPHSGAAAANRVSLGSSATTQRPELDPTTAVGLPAARHARAEPYPRQLYPPFTEPARLRVAGVTGLRHTDPANDPANGALL
jgi:hypothetical protein